MRRLVLTALLSLSAGSAFSQDMGFMYDPTYYVGGSIGGVFLDTTIGGFNTEGDFTNADCPSSEGPIFPVAGFPAFCDNTDEALAWGLVVGHAPRPKPPRR